MNVKSLQLKRALHTALLVLLLSAEGMTKGYAETIGDLVYSLNKNTLTAAVIRHKDNGLTAHNAIGTLTIPSTVTYTHEEYINGQYVYVTRTYTVTEISGDILYDYSNPYYATPIYIGAFAGCSGLTGELIIPNTITTIGGSAFSGCSGFTGLTIGNSVTTIAGSAFKDCSGFTGNLTIPNSVTSIGSYAFKGCSGFTGSLTIPNSVTSIGQNAFEGCSGFTGNLTIGNSVTTIANYTFEGCSGFTGNLIIGNSVTEISLYAFKGCSGLTGNLTIDNSVTTIRNYAFFGCSGFSGNLTIGNSVTTIAQCAFEGCSGFTSITAQAETPITIYSRTFYNVPKSIPVYVPYGTIGTYQAAPGWNEFTNYQEIAYKTIPSYNESNDHYRFIASPLVDSIAPTSVDNLITETAYDLYRFSPADSLGEWQNYKTHTDDFKLVNGQGYLYANENEVNIIFKGEFNEDVTKEVNLVYDANDKRKCWNLVGNPFPVSANLNKPYYVLDENGTGINPNPVPATTPIPPCTAVFVKAEGDGETVVFTRVAP